MYIKIYYFFSLVVDRGSSEREAERLSFIGPGSKFVFQHEQLSV